MKRILFILAFLCVLDFAAMAQGAPPLCMSEVDGSPNKCGITRIKVTNGTLSITGSVATITISGGGGGSPGGSTTQVQYNDTGAFAGAAGFTFNGTSTVTLGVAGTSVGAIAFKNATSGTITLQPVAGALGTVTLSLPAATDTLVGLAATQTLTNKTLTAPVIATISNTGTLTLPTSTDTLVGRATTDTFTNKTLTASSNVLGGVTMTLGSDADGDIYYRASNVLTRLPKGTALQVLRMNAGATAPEWAAAAGGGGITVGTTTITSGTDTRVLYNNAGVVGEYAVTGTGNAVLSASPTLTGRVSAADGLFATAVTTGTGASAGLQVTANSLTTGNGAEFSSSSVTSGNVVSIAATGTAAASNTKTALNVATSGANATSTQTTYGAQISNTSTGTSSTNVALQLTASGGSNNYAINVTAGQNRFAIDQAGGNIGLIASGQNHFLVSADSGYAFGISTSATGAPNAAAFRAALGFKTANFYSSGTGAGFIFSSSTSYNNNISTDSIVAGLVIPGTTAIVRLQGSTITAAGAFSSPALTPAQITANQDNYAPGVGLFQRWSSDASRNVTGRSAGQAGEFSYVWNVGSTDIVLVNESASSTAANRFTNSTGADITLTANKCAFMQYDATSSRWRVTLLP